MDLILGGGSQAPPTSQPTGTSTLTSHQHAKRAHGQTNQQPALVIHNKEQQLEQTTSSTPTTAHQQKLSAGCSSTREITAKHSSSTSSVTRLANGLSKSTVSQPSDKSHHTDADHQDHVTRKFAHFQNSVQPNPLNTTSGQPVRKSSEELFSVSSSKLLKRSTKPLLSYFTPSNPTSGIRRISTTTHSALIGSVPPTQSSFLPTSQRVCNGIAVPPAGVQTVKPRKETVLGTESPTHGGTTARWASSVFGPAVSFRGGSVKKMSDSSSVTDLTNTTHQSSNIIIMDENLDVPVLQQKGQVHRDQNGTQEPQNAANGSTQDLDGLDDEDQKQPLHVELVWRNLIYKVENLHKSKSKSKSRSKSKTSSPLASLGQGLSKCLPCISTTPKYKTILNNLSGSVQTGQLIAVIGPSGAGKSTLLECLAGHRTTGLVGGQILVTKSEHVHMAFIGQQDHHLRQLTVRECLLYASKIKNCHSVNQRNEEQQAEERAHKERLRRLGSRLSLTSSQQHRQSVVNSLISGTVNLVGPHMAPPDVKIEDLDQHETDHFVSKLDSEPPSRKFSSKLSASICSLLKPNPHKVLVDNVMRQLGLESCADTRIANCSGGQLKRLSICLELISRPQLILLDEPTSGLDSSSAFQCVQLLRRLTLSTGLRQGTTTVGTTSITTNPIAIIASIHQPSARVLSTFDLLYVLSAEGRCIYQGPTRQLLNVLAAVDLHCPTYHNPADYMLEIACGDHGDSALERLAAHQEKQFEDSFREGSQESLVSLKQSASSRLQKFPFFLHMWLLLCRTFLTILREPFLTSLRFGAYLSVAIMIATLYGQEIGREPGCIPVFANGRIPAFFARTPDNDLSRESLVSENVAFLFFSLLFIIFSSMMPTALTFPLDMSVFLRERQNGWYSCGTYFLAKTLADLPFQIIFPFLYVITVYYWTGQDQEEWRVIAFICVTILLALISQSIGLLIGAVFVDSVEASVFVTPLSAIPALLFSGFFVRIKTMPVGLQPVSYTSYFRFAFEALIISTYGYGRCQKQTSSDPRRPRSAYLEESDPHHMRSIFLGLDENVTTELPPNSTSLENHLDQLEAVTGNWSENEILDSYRDRLGPVSPVSEIFHSLDPSTLGQHLNNGLAQVGHLSHNTDSYLNSTLLSGLNSSVELPSNLTQQVYKSELYVNGNYYHGARLESIIMRQFDLTDEVFPRNIAILILFVLGLRFIAFWILLYKSNRKK